MNCEAAAEIAGHLSAISYSLGLIMCCAVYMAVGSGFK